MKDMAFAQLDTPPDGLRMVSLLTATPEVLTEAYGLRFKTVRGDLDELVWAAIELDGEPFMFVRHARSPEPGTELWARGPATAAVRELDLLESWRAESPPVSSPAPGSP